MALFWSARLFSCMCIGICPAHLLILRKKSPLHGLFWVCTYNVFLRIFPPARLFCPTRLFGTLEYPIFILHYRSHAIHQGKAAQRRTKEEILDCILKILLCQLMTASTLQVVMQRTNISKMQKKIQKQTKSLKATKVLSLIFHFLSLSSTKL